MARSRGTNMMVPPAPGRKPSVGLAWPEVSHEIYVGSYGGTMSDFIDMTFEIGDVTQTSVRLFVSVIGLRLTHVV